MDLVVDEVVELEDVHVPDRDLRIEGLAGPALEEGRLPVGADQTDAVVGGTGVVQQVDEFGLAGAVEHRRREADRTLHVRVLVGPADLGEPLGRGLEVPAVGRGPPEVGLEHLTDVHPRRHTQWVEHDVQRRAILEEGHVLHRQDLGDDALVAVASGELVTLGDLRLLGDVDPHHVVDARGQLVAVGTAEPLDTDDDAAIAVWDLQRGVADLTSLLTEDRAQQPLLRGQLRLTLGGDLAHQDVAGLDLGADPDDALLVEVGEHLLGHVGDVAGDLLRAELGLAGIDLELLDVDRGEHVLSDQTLGEDDRVLEVEALPGHEPDQQVPPERELSVVGGGTVGDGVADLESVALGDQGPLVDAAALVRALELGEVVPVDLVVVGPHDHVVRRHLDDDTGVGRRDHVAGVASGLGLDTGPDER